MRSIHKQEDNSKKDVKYDKTNPFAEGSVERPWPICAESHCTKARGPCDHPWVREETLDKCLVSLFEEIQIDEETVRDIVRALKDSSKKENTFRQIELERLNRRSEELQSRLDKAYVDRLDANIHDSYWRQISNKWRVEQDLVSTQINRLTNSNRDYVEQAVEILELSKAAHSLYLQRDVSEKRQLLKTVLSNCVQMA